MPFIALNKHFTKFKWKKKNGLRSERKILFLQGAKLVISIKNMYVSM